MERLLIFEPRVVGDSIMSVAFLRAALSKYEVFVCCRHSTVSIFAHWLPLERILAWDPPWLDTGQAVDLKAQAGLLSFIRSLRALKAQVAVSVWADPRTQALMVLSGARIRVGFSILEKNYYANHLAWRRKQLMMGKVLASALALVFFRPLLTQALVRKDYLSHHMEGWEQIGEALGLTWDRSKPWLIGERDRHSASEFREKGWVIHPGARLEAHRWPLSKFEELMDTFFVKRQIPFLVISPPELELPKGWESKYWIVQPGSLEELEAVVGNASGLLCNDTGVSHIGAGLGKRVVALFAASEPRWFGPYNSLENVVTGGPCPFKPCFGRCQMPQYVCMNGIDVKSVISKLSIVCPS